MKIYNKIGSKERLFEMIKAVNKIWLNESEIIDGENILERKFNELKTGQLNVKQSNVQMENEKSYVELVCGDNEGNEFKLNFEVEAQPNELEGVYSITSAQLIEFTVSGNANLKINADGLVNFNGNHANEMVEIVSNYVDFDDSTPEMDETYFKAIEKIDSYPFGGTPRTMKSSKAYGGEQPTNKKLRVSSPLLNNIIDEETMIDTDSVIGNYFDGASGLAKQEAIAYAKKIVDNKLKSKGMSRLDVNPQQYIRTIKDVAIRLHTGYLTRTNENDEYPKEIGKKFKTKKQYRGEKKKKDTVTTIDEIGAQPYPERWKEMDGAFMGPDSKSKMDEFLSNYSPKNVGSEMNEEDTSINGQIMAQLQPTEPINVKLIDKRDGSEKTITVGQNGVEGSVDEGLMNALKVGAVCTILATGMVSCSKTEDGVGYNITAHPTEYDLTKQGNSTDDILTPSGIKTINVDSNTSVNNKAGYSSALHLTTTPSEYESIVLKFGASIEQEIRSNNGNGYDANKTALNFKTNDVTIEPNDSYTTQSTGSAPINVREHQYFINGIKYMKQYPKIFKKETGLDASEVLSKL